MKKILIGLIIALGLVLSMSACADEGSDVTVNSGSEELSAENNQNSNQEADTNGDSGKESEADNESNNESESETRSWSPYV